MLYRMYTLVGLWWLNATYNIISVIYIYIVTVNFLGGGGGNRKTTDLPQVTDKPYYIMLYTSP